MHSVNPSVYSTRSRASAGMHRRPFTPEAVPPRRGTAVFAASAADLLFSSSPISNLRHPASVNVRLFVGSSSPNARSCLRSIY